MATYPQKQKMKVAQQSASKKFNLSHVHIASLSAMRPLVAAVRDTIPNEKGTFSVNPFVKLNPLNVPTFGDISVHLRHFLVPIRTIWPQFNDFITDTLHMCADGDFVVPATTPYFTCGDIYEAFIATAPNGHSPYATTTTGTAFDFRVGTTKYKFTRRGSFAWQLLCSLGYNVPILSAKVRKFSALRLLAFARVYSDWYQNSQYAEGLAVAWKVRALFVRDESSPLHLTKSELFDIFDLCEFVCYLPDYFTSAWDNPVSPNAGDSSSSFVFSDYDISAGVPSVSDTNVSYAPSSWMPLVEMDSSSSSGLATFSQYMIDSLKSLNDYLKRNQMSGTYAIDRYLSRFGTILSAEKLNRSIMLGQSDVPVKISDVTSTADTDNASLGSFTGQGVASQNSTEVQYSSNEFCILLSVASIVPKHVYFQGLDRNILHVDKGSWFTPEFDNLGVQGISKAELLVHQDTSTGNDAFGTEAIVSQIFGYAPRYSEWKVGRDVVSGDFMNLSTRKALLTWFFPRYIEPSNYSQSSLVHSPDFVKGYDGEQYDRIFQGTVEGDNYNVIFSINWTAWMQALPLYDTYEFDSKGDSIVVDTNGTKEN